MKVIRRSIKGEKSDSKPQHVSISQKSAIAILPPKKVIKALFDYQPDSSNPHELGFHKGDFFHVISRENDEDWYEACNPLIPSARGLVPVSYFEVIGKTERHSVESGGTNAQLQRSPTGGRDITPISSGLPTPASTIGSPAKVSSSGASHFRGPSIARGAMVYGVVQYDFSAERPDELDAKAGEAIIVIAQSNPEWFVAKPIGRLGGPGLIPVAYTEIRDMATNQPVPDPHRAVQAAGVPKVEEWKKLAADYKNSSISLGKFEAPKSLSPGSLSHSMDRLSLTSGPPHSNGYHHSQPSPGGQPLEEPQLLAPVSASVPRYCFENDKYWYIIECVLADGSHWELSRYYQNFYDFQIKLLQQFPQEGDNNSGTRILPFMPGPVTYVTDAISNGRRESLDDYVKRLLALPPYISRCRLVRELFAPREGDYELDPRAMQEDFRLSRASQQSATAGPGQDMSRQSSHTQTNGHYGASAMNQPRPGTATRQPNNGGYGTGISTNTYGASNGTSMSTGYVNGSNNGYGTYRPTGLPAGSAANGGPGTALSSVPAPSATPVNGAEGMPSYLKIKVFWAEDCIAIRMPADMNFAQLRDKLHERLGARDDLLIQYKDEPTGGYAEINGDRELEIALQRNANKLVLYVGYA